MMSAGLVQLMRQWNENFFKGEGGSARDHRTSFHAIARILRNEGIFGIYTGFVCHIAFMCYIYRLVFIILFFMAHTCVHN